MRRCPACGSEAAAAARFCTTCGSPVGPLRSPTVAPSGSGLPRVYAGVLVPPDPGPRPRRTARWLAVVAAVALLGVGTATALRATGDDDEARTLPPSARSPLEKIPALRPPSAELVVGETVDLRVAGGVAVTELVAEARVEVVLNAGDARVVVWPDPVGPVDAEGDDGEGGVAGGGGDAGGGDGGAAGGGGGPTSSVGGVDLAVTSLPAGRHRVLVVPPGDAAEVAVSVQAVARVPLGEGERMAGRLDADAPVVDVVVSPGADHAWNLVAEDAPPAAEVRDVTGGIGVAAGAPVCDLTDPACDLVGGRDYVVRVATGGDPVDYDLRFEDRPPTGGPGSVTFDGRDAPVTGLVGPGRTEAYDLRVGVPDGVVLTIAPVGPWDPGVRLDGDLVGDGGPGEADRVRVPPGVRHTLVVGGGGTGGAYRITVARG